jgi:hypothetical protein
MEYAMSEAENTKPAAPQTAPTDPQKQGMQHESDIGSGEPSPGQQETDDMIRSIPPTPKDGGGDTKK